MEISEREYFELKEQVRVLQEKVNGIEKQRKQLADLITEMPIGCVRNTMEDFPDFKYEENGNSDAWNIFMKLAKLVHTSSWKFNLEQSYVHPWTKRIRLIGHNETPKRITELTAEQIDISVQMLNEMIPIYNKYFKQMHEYVLYCDTNDGQYRKIYVEKELEE